MKELLLPVLGLMNLICGVILVYHTNPDLAVGISMIITGMFSVIPLPRRS